MCLYILLYCNNVWLLNYIFYYRAKTNMRRNKKSPQGITSIEYSLISIIVAVSIIGAVSALGVKVGSTINLFGNSISASRVPTPTPTPTPTPQTYDGMTLNTTLTSAQQAEIVNAVSEINAGTATLACLQSLNANQNNQMVANNASCIGPGYGIAPPATPYMLQIAPDGSDYDILQDGSTYGTNSELLQEMDNILGFPPYGPLSDVPTYWLYNDGCVGGDECYILYDMRGTNTTYNGISGTSGLNLYQIANVIGVPGPPTLAVLPLIANILGLNNYYNGIAW